MPNSIIKEVSVYLSMREIWDKSPRLHDDRIFELVNTCEEMGVRYQVSAIMKAGIGDGHPAGTPDFRTRMHMDAKACPECSLFITCHTGDWACFSCHKHFMAAGKLWLVSTGPYTKEHKDDVTANLWMPVPAGIACPGAGAHGDTLVCPECAEEYLRHAVYKDHIKAANSDPARFHVWMNTAIDVFKTKGASLFPGGTARYLHHLVNSTDGTRGDWEEQVFPWVIKRSRWIKDSQFRVPKAYTKAIKVVDTDVCL